MDVGASVVEGRKKESGHRRLYPPVPRTFFDTTGRFIVGETGLRELYRADGAEDVVIDLVRGVKHFLVTGRSAGNIVGAVDQHDIVVFTVIIVFDHFIIEGIHRFIISKLFIAELH